MYILCFTTQTNFFKNTLKLIQVHLGKYLTYDLRSVSEEVLDHSCVLRLLLFNLHLLPLITKYILPKIS